MDLTGIPAYEAVMKALLPDLNCATEVPRLMRKVVNSGARGVANAKGFYRYTPRPAKRWEELFIAFLGGHPKPAIGGQLKTGHRETV
jgi:3-hydroxybutyryl-CoA dehydrogenase